MLNRRTVILAVGGSLLAASFASHAQKPAKAFRVGFLSGGPRPADGAPPPPCDRRSRNSAMSKARM